MKVLISFILMSIFFPKSDIDKKSAKKTKETIHWYTFQEAIIINEKEPKKIFIDIYTDWCFWCKKMDKTTFNDPSVIEKINKYYYAVKLNAEMKDTIIFKDKTFINPNPNDKKSTHQLANALLNGQMGYPTSVYLDEKFAMLGPVAGYQTAADIEPILIYFGENKYLTSNYDDFLKNFQSQEK